MKRVKNEQVMSLITQLQTLASEQKVPLWKRIASDLGKPTQSRREVNLYKLDQYCKEGDVVLVPGKVLGSGVISKSLTVAALHFSQSARDAIIANKGTVLTIKELMDKNPKGSKVRLMG